MNILRVVLLSSIALWSGWLPVSADDRIPTTLAAVSRQLYYLNSDDLPGLFKALPAPPQPDSLAAKADLESVLQVQAWRTQDQIAFAKQIDTASVFDCTEILGPWFTAAHLPELDRFLKQIHSDANAVNNGIKDHIARLRPPYQDPRVKPCITTPQRGSYSYPSGHSTRFHLAALVLAELFPDRRDDLLAWSDRVAWGRIIAGVHFPSDDVGGRILAEALFADLRKHPEFIAALEACRAEVAPYLLKKAG
jgi:acid phosphatase (class A)